jgi:Zn-finger nucleic acid-binding protein
MKCPACFNELTQLQVGKVTIDACQDGCGGIWFDNFELQQVDDQTETAGERLMELRRDPKVVVDFSRKRPCPRCADVKLQRHFFSARRKVEVDQCPNCGGYWLDAGELATIRDEKAAVEKASVAAQGFSSETIRYLYRLRSQSKSA